jgi:hypothetical protein
LFGGGGRIEDFARVARILFLLGLLPVILGIAARKWFGERVLASVGKEEGESCQLNGEAFLTKLGEVAQIPSYSCEGNWNKATVEKVLLSQELGSRSDRLALAETGLLVGLNLLAQRQPELLKWRYSALKFSWAFPAFTLLVVIFAALAGSFVRWLLPVASLALALGTMAGWLAVWIDWQASTLTAGILEKRAIIAREDDRRAIERAMRGLAARRFVPGLLSVLFPSRK